MKDKIKKWFPEENCQVCGTKNAKNLEPMRVFEPQTNKFHSLERVCPRCQESLEKNPNRVLFVVGKICHSCKMPFGLRVNDKVIRRPRPITYRGEKYKVCKMCSNFIKKELKSGVDEIVKELDKGINARDKKINRIRTKKRKSKEKQPLTQKIDQLTFERDALIKKKYGYAICHLKSRT